MTPEEEIQEGIVILEKEFKNLNDEKIKEVIELIGTHLNEDTTVPDIMKIVNTVNKLPTLERKFFILKFFEGVMTVMVAHNEIKGQSDEHVKDYLSNKPLGYA